MHTSRLQPILRWTLRVLLGAGVLVLIAGIAGATYEAAATSRDAAAHPAPGRLVDVGTHRLHLSCVGEGSPTVVFDSGLANMSTDWANVQPRVGTFARACAYDRAGIGWSGDGPQPRDARRIADELHTLLMNGGVAGPYVLVGQSFGGLYVRMFADLYPDEVAGMVLVDASHPDMWSRVPAQLTAAMVPSTSMGLLYRGMAHLGILRLTAANPPQDCGLDASHCDEERAWRSSARATDAYVAEMGAPDRDAQVRASGKLGDRPLVVLTATNHAAEFGAFAPEVDPIWLQLQTELAALSTHARHDVVAGATHSSLQLRDADTTSAAIEQVVQAVRSGQRLAPTAGPLVAGAEPEFAAVDRFMESERRAMRVPGLAVGIVRRERVVHVAGFGTADASGRPVTAQTPLLTASLNKSVTALAVMQLVEAGKIDLDAPVQRYITWFRVADPAASARITVRHLLNQNSGFPTFPASEGMVGGDMSGLAIERGVRGLADVSLSQPVGATYQYSNFNYMTLGLVVQTVSGEPYEDYVQAHIFAPLQMQRSFTSQAAAQPFGLTSGYRFWFGVPVATDLTYSRKLVPSGGLVSTSEDLAHFLVAQLNDGRYGGTSVLSAAGIAAQHAPAVSTGSTDAFYGMGWEAGVADGRRIVHHNGTLPTGYADFFLLPDEDVGVVVLANATNLAVLPRLDALAPGVASMVNGRQPTAVSEARLFQVLPFISLVVVALQVFWILRSAVELRRWQTQPERRPRGPRLVVWHIGLPLALNLGWATVILVALPKFFGLPVGDTLFLLGDYAFVLAVSAVVAVIWGVLRTVLVWRMVSAPRSPARVARVDQGQPVHQLGA